MYDPPQPTTRHPEHHQSFAEAASYVTTSLTPPEQGDSQNTAFSDFKQRMLEEIRESFTSYMQATLDDALERALRSRPQPPTSQAGDLPR